MGDLVSFSCSLLVAAALWTALVHFMPVSLLPPATCHEWHKRWERLGRSQAAGVGSMGLVMEVSVQPGYEVVCAAGPLGVRGNCLGLLGFCRSLTVCPQKELNNFAAQRPSLAHFGVSHKL